MTAMHDAFLADEKIRHARAIAHLISFANELQHELQDDLALAGAVVVDLLDDAIRLTDAEKPEETAPPAGQGKTAKPPKIRAV